MSYEDLLPESLLVEIDGPVARLTLNRAHKRNALDNEIVFGMGKFFENLPEGVRVVVLDAAGDNFSAGLDLSSLTETTTFEGVLHSRGWHKVFESIEHASVPVVAVLKGAVIGGGLELATVAHIRVAEPSAYYALPEGVRGIFVGGGASVRVPRFLGAHRMADMMLTGRVLSSDEGHALGLSQYLVGEGEGLAKAQELASQIAKNSPITNYAVVNVLPRIAQGDPEGGYMMESLVSAISQGTEESKERLRAFLAGKANKITPDSEADDA